jgi:hypothetical protein
MNRIVVFGLALFFALVGIALVGGEKKASAFIFGRLGGGGYAAGGCDGGCGGCHGGCNGGCHHRNRCHGGCHARNRCHGRCHGRCNGGCNGGCHGGGGCCGGGYVQAPMMAPEKQVPPSVQAPIK